MSEPDLLQDFLTKKALGRAWGIQVLADTLAKEMQRIHGGTYRTVIDHEDGFISILQDRRPA